MKTITSAEATLSADGKTLTVICDVSEQPFNSLLTTRNSHFHINPLHDAHPRRIQSSNAAIFCEAPTPDHKTAKAAILNEAVAAIFAVLEPQTTFLPQLKKMDTGAIHVISEIPVTFQWQVSDDNKTWMDIAGQTGANLDDAATQPGQWSRLVITNAAGSTIGPPLQKPIAK